MNKEKLKILLTLVHSTRNAGDLALLEVSIRLIKNFFPDAVFVISTNYPNEEYYCNKDYQVVPSIIALVGESYGRPKAAQIIHFMLGGIYCLIYKLGFHFCVPVNWSLLLRAYFDCDIVIAVPGNQFYSTGKFGWPFPVRIMEVFMAHLFNKPLYILPQSIGPLKRWWEKKLLKWCYSKAEIIFLRDQFSIELAMSLGIPINKVFYGIDPAFALLPEAEEEALKLLISHGWTPNKPSLGVTVIAPMGKSLSQDIVRNYYEILARGIADFALKHDFQIVFFCQVCGPTYLENDRYPTLSIYQKVCSVTSQVILVDTIVSPQLLKACYGKMDIFLASRLHSGIFSISMGVPTIFIGYLPKTMGILKSLEIEDFCIDIIDLTKVNIEERLHELWKESNRIRRRLAEVQRVIQNKVQEPFQKIFFDITSNKNLKWERIK
ncbi:MAG: polysaccharide pyruvyl transferase family protein [Candidatus Methanomethyliaceae archaeon]